MHKENGLEVLKQKVKIYELLMQGEKVASRYRKIVEEEIKAMKKLISEFS